VGGSVGYATAGTDSTFRDDSVPSNFISSGDHSDALYGVHVGYNYQQCMMVLGIEGDWTWMQGSAKRVNNQNLASIGDADIAKSQLSDLPSLRGRAGVVVDNFLVYATGGVAWAQANYKFGDVGPIANEGAATFNLNTTGAVFGGGVEFPLWHGALVRAEYLRYAFNHSRLIPDVAALPNGSPGPNGVDYRLSDVDTFKIGLSLKLDGLFDRLVPR
jgi:outer membrane immunogenic protein